MTKDSQAGLLADSYQETVDGVTVGHQVIGGIPVVAVTFDFAHRGGRPRTRNIPHVAGAANRAGRGCRGAAPCSPMTEISCP
jgi:hypothetical protein